MGRNRRVTQLKSSLERVRKIISSLQKELEDVNSKRIKAYKRAYELGEQKQEWVSTLACCFHFHKRIHINNSDNDA